LDNLACPAVELGFIISKEAVIAGNLLASHLFHRDTYPGRNTPEFWTKFCYPFWFTDLLSALDSLSQIGLGREEGRIQEALDWLVEWQAPDGKWRVSLLRSGGNKQVDLWVGFAICRLFKRLYI
jgi:hypothetical protein